ncbi:MAG: hypothetical protein JSV49_10985 [Thermoplasmata archaeon]|nr:MAG: hypothetical protein JSV49_10985 [Thermoplasmata archaeon]
MLKKAIAVLVLGLVLVIYIIIPFFLPMNQDQQFSAWDEDYDDTSTIRTNVDDMHRMEIMAEDYTYSLFNLDESYTTRSIVTGPMILSIDSIDPEQSVYVMTGLERAYSQEDLDALTNYVQNGGHIIIADSGDNIRSFAAQYGVTYYPGKFFDESYDRNSSYTQVIARLGVDHVTPKYIPNLIEENLLINGEDLPYPDGVWDDDTDADGKIDEDPVEAKYAPVVDDDKDMGMVNNDGRDNDNDWVVDDGGYDANEKSIDIIGYAEGVNEDPVDDDGDGLEDEEYLNGQDDDEDGLVDEDIMQNRLIMSDPSGMSSIGSRVIAHGSVNSYVDMNGDGKITTPKAGDPQDELIDAISSPGSEVQLIVEVVVSPENGQPVDLTGYTETIVGTEKVREVSTLDLSGTDDVERAYHDMSDVHEFGSIIFIADSSIFINDLVDLDHITYAYPYDGKDNDGDGIIDEKYEIEEDKYDLENDGNNIQDNTPDGLKDYDNAMFFMQLIYYFLPDGGTVIFDESRHAQMEAFMVPVYATINTVVFLTSDPVYATSLILVTIFVLILAVIITRDKENWVHKFDTSKFKGRKTVPETRRDKARILRKATLEKIRLGRSLSPDEFAQLSPKVVDSFIRDPQLIELVRNEGKDYSENELVALSQKILAIR